MDYLFLGLIFLVSITVLYKISYNHFRDIETVEKMGVYTKYKDMNMVMITDTEKTDYKTITEKIKKNCEFYDVVEHNETDYLCYSCPQSKYKGKIGFTVMNGSGTIIHFPINFSALDAAIKSTLFERVSKACLELRPSDDRFSMSLHQKCVSGLRVILGA